MKKIIILSVLLLGVVIFSGCGQQKVSQSKNPVVNKTLPDTSQAINATPTDETTSWKTYENAQYGFSIKYPPKTIYDESKAGDLLALSFEDEGIERNLSSSILNFQIKHSDYKTIEEYKSYLLESLKKCQPQADMPNLCRAYNFSEITVLGNRALVDNWSENKLKTVWFIKDGLLYKIAGHTLKNSFSVDQMIANLNFSK
jgi:hypothetical protein